jgi:cytochrome P450
MKTTTFSNALASTDHASPRGPSDRSWGFSLLRRMRADYLGFVTSLQREYGDLTRMRLINEDAWDLMSPALIREAMVTQSGQLIRWERATRVFSQLFGQSVLVTHGDTWQRQRRMLMPAFTARRVGGYAQLMTDAARTALDQAVPGGESSAQVSMNDLWNGATMDVILRTLFSESVQTDAQAAAKATQTLMTSAFREMFVPWTVPLWLPTPNNARKRHALATLRGLVGRHIEARWAASGDEPPRDDLLQMLLAARDDATGDRLSKQEVFDQCMVSFEAGHETSATTLLWWSLLLARHPEAARRAQREVDEVLRGATPGAQHVDQLPWLQATLKETLRAYPAVSVLMTRRNTDPITLAGHAVPKGAMLRVTPWVIHHDERWFPQPDRFMPERFLDDAPHIPKGAWIPFGIGPHVCIGQHFAMLEMTLLAAMLLQRYTLSLDDDGHADHTPQLSVTLRPRDPVRLRLTRRHEADDCGDSHIIGEVE